MTAEIDYKNYPVLFVDDEQNVLESYRRMLRSHFKVVTALGGVAGLESLTQEGPFAVVVSDIKMPHMDGIEFLSKVKEKFPKVIRMVLTGYADLDTAINAVNHGDIFRFLTKPCDNNDLVNALISGIEQYQMTQAAQELELVRRMKDGMEGTLRAFTRLVEFRDPYTAGHMDRTAEISSLIATRLGMDTDATQGLHLAALVHDIGKIAVPSGILNKPGSLSDAEFAIIKAHPLVGAEIFQSLETDWPIGRIIVEHHERIDGSGYPNGLYDDEILQESKILAVADMIDAIMTNRPYRPNLGEEETINILNKTRGRKLDEPSVAAGISLIRDGLIIGDKFS